MLAWSFLFFTRSEELSYPPIEEILATLGHYASPFSGVLIGLRKERKTKQNNNSTNSSHFWGRQTKMFVKNSEIFG